MTRRGMSLILCGLLTLSAVGQTYCVPSIGNQCSGTGYEYIGNVTIGAINNTTACVIQPAYSDFTALPAAQLPANVAVPISVTVNNYWSSDEIQIYCDWDQNGTLGDPGEFTLIPDTGPGGTGTTNQVYSGTITAPFGTTGTRMRVILYYAQGGVPDPCPTSATYAFGEIEDYTVDVVGGGPPPCLTQFSSPGGAGSVLVSNNPCAALAGAAYFWAFTFVPGTFPAGGWFGLDIGLAQLVSFYLAGYPFTGLLDGSGASSFGVPGGSLPSGLQVWEVTTIWAPGYSNFLLAYPPKTYTIP